MSVGHFTDENGKAPPSFFLIRTGHSECVDCEFEKILHGLVIHQWTNHAHDSQSIDRNFWKRKIRFDVWDTRAVIRSADIAPADRHGLYRTSPEILFKDVPRRRDLGQLAIQADHSLPMHILDPRFCRA